MNKKRFCLVLLMIFNCSYLLAQISVHLQQPHPFQFHVEDMWKVTLTSTYQTPVRVYLYGTARSLTEGLIVDANTAIFSMNIGTRMVKANEIGPIDVHKQNQTYGDIVKKMGGLPSGKFEICVYVKDAATNQTLAVDCIEHEVQNFTEVELISPISSTVISNEYFEIDEKTSSVSQKKLTNNPIPVLKLPDSPFGTFDKYTIDKIKKAEQVLVGAGQFVVFNWMPPTPVPKGYGLKYKLNVVEILARQSAYDAIKTNPYYYTNSNITTSTFQYPLSASPFKHGRSYGWQVTAYVNNIKISESEIWEFTYLNFTGSVTQNKNLKSEGETTLLNDLARYDISPKEYIKSLREERLLGASTMDINAKSKPLEFNLFSKGYGEYNNSRTPGNEQPNNLGNLELVPTIKIYGVPFSMPLFFSSQGNPDKQRINTFGLMFDKDHWKKKIESMIKDEKDKIEKRVEDEKNKIEQKIIQEKDKIQNRINEELEKIKNMPAEEKAKLEQKLMQEKTDLEKKLYDEKDKLEKKVLDDKDKQVDEIKDGKKLLTGALKWVSYIKSFGFGTTYPDYTRYTVTGVSSTGFDVELNPGLLYLAATGFRTQKAITNESYERRLIAGRLGIGEKDRSHFILTYMYAKDDENSMTVDTAVIKTLTPASNHLIGAEGNLSFFNNRLRIEAEGNASLFTRDVRAASMESEDIPQYVKNMFDPKVSSNIDYMYTFKAGFDNEKSDTKVSFSMMMIGPGYYSLGAENIRNDKFGFEGKVDQKILKKALSFTFNFKTSKDNLISSKASTTTVTSFGANIGINFRGYPYLRIMYMPFFQSNDREITTTDSNKIDNKTHILNLIAGYSKSFGSIFSQTNAIFSLQNTRTLFGLYDASTNNFTLSQTFGFKIPLTVSASVGFINSSYKGGEDSHLLNVDFSTGYTFFDVWQNSAGVTLNTEKNKNDKYGFFLNSSMFLWNVLNLDFRYDYNSYKEYILVNPNNYKESSFRGTATINF
jgi:hypothetical protein